MSRVSSVQEAALAVVRRLRDAGHQALWAGGSVRDMLLKCEPKDVDVATSARPDEIMKLFRVTKPVGAHFGVVMVRQGPFWIETATFRSDVAYTDGRHPTEVVFSDPEQDAQRRDFTINGLFYDPIDDRIIDYVGGRADIEAGVIRAIGDPQQRFAEDHLRMLRAVRFATRLNFAIDAATADAIRSHAEKITRISPERIHDELDKMFSHPTRAASFRLLHELRLLPHLWPGSVWAPGQVDRAARALAAMPESADFVLSMAAILHESRPAEVTRIARELRCSNQDADAMGWLVATYRELDRAADLSLAELKRLMAHPRFEDLLSLHRAALEVRDESLEANETARRRSKAIPPEEVTPPPLVRGEDLMALGLKPGPAFKRILTRLQEEQLNLKLTGREEALRRLEQLAREEK